MSAEIGVFGGSGFYSLLDDVREIKVDTPYGPPSDSVMLAEVAGRKTTKPRTTILLGDGSEGYLVMGVK